MSASAIDRHIRSGAWEVVHPGVYRVSGSPRTWEQAVMAAALWSGPDGVLFRRTAAALWEIDGSHKGVIEIVSPRTPRAICGFKVHKRILLDPEDVTMLGAYPVTTLPRTIIDLGSIYGPSRLEGFLDAGLRRRAGILPEVTDCFERLACRGRNGIASVRAVLEERDPSLGVPDSNIETSFAQMARRYGLPRYATQHPVRRPGGRFAFIDFCYPDVMLAIEVDGRLTHSDLLDREDDYERAAELVAMGWRILRFTSRQIRRKPEWVARQIIVALEIGGSGVGFRR
jgi:very-short-patch-repair endonuclease